MLITIFIVRFNYEMLYGRDTTTMVEDTHTYYIYTYMLVLLLITMAHTYTHINTCNRSAIFKDSFGLLSFDVS